MARNPHYPLAFRARFGDHPQGRVQWRVPAGQPVDGEQALVEFAVLLHPRAQPGGQQSRHIVVAAAPMDWGRNSLRLWILLL